MTVYVYSVRAFVSDYHSICIHKRARALGDVARERDERDAVTRSRGGGRRRCVRFLGGGVGRERLRGASGGGARRGDAAERARRDVEVHVDDGRRLGAGVSDDETRGGATHDATVDTPLAG